MSGVLALGPPTADMKHTFAPSFGFDFERGGHRMTREQRRAALCPTQIGAIHPNLSSDSPSCTPRTRSKRDEHTGPISSLPPRILITCANMHTSEDGAAHSITRYFSMSCDAVPFTDHGNLGCSLAVSMSFQVQQDSTCVDEGTQEYCTIYSKGHS